MERDVIVGAEPGKEKRVLRDVLDLLFPYDPKVAGFIAGPGRVVINTRVGVSELTGMLRSYPIRGLLNARLLIAVYESLEALLCSLPRDLCASGFRARRVRVKLRRGWRQEYYRELMRSLGRAYDYKSGWDVLVEELDGKVAVEVFLFRPRRDSFGIHT